MGAALVEVGARPKIFELLVLARDEDLQQKILDSPTSSTRNGRLRRNGEGETFLSALVPADRTFVVYPSRRSSNSSLTR